jgi:hypothetical protein
VTVAVSLDSASRLLEAERDENTQRKDMKPSEKVSLGESLREEYARQAERAHREGSARGGRAEGSEKFTEPSPVPRRNGETREKLGAAVGMGATSYTRAKAVGAAAEDVTTPELPPAE